MGSTADDKERKGSHVSKSSLVLRPSLLSCGDEKKTGVTINNIVLRFSSVFECA